MLEEACDPTTARHLEQIGVAPGWCCLETGAVPAPSPAVSGRVGRGGAVVATDINPRFLDHLSALGNVELRVFTSIASKLLAGFIVLGLVTIGLTAWVSFRTSNNALERASLERLTAVRATKQRQIETTLADLRAQARGMAESTLARDALRQLAAGFESAPPVQDGEDTALRNYYLTQYLPKLNGNLSEPASLETFLPADPLTRHWQERYIAGNEYPLGAKDNLVQTGDRSAYDAAHARFHAVFRNFIERFGFYDLFLIDARSGPIVYTVFREADFATSLLDGPYAGTNLAQLFQAALRSSAPEFNELVDYQALRALLCRAGGIHRRPRSTTVSRRSACWPCRCPSTRSTG